MNNRVTNQTVIVEADQAKAMLRNKHLQTDSMWPGLNVLEVLLAAYPEAQLSGDSDGTPGGTNWQTLAWALANDFVPAFQPGGTPGRPVAKKDGLVAAVEALLASHEASNVTHACNIIERRNLFPEITDVRKAYYRRRK